MVWLYAGRTSFPPRAVELIENEPLLLSPMALLELDYLHEIKRIEAPSAIIVNDLASRMGLRVCDLPFERVARAATEMRWTRDPFDRLIVAQASVGGAPLLTRDQTIRDNVPFAVWDEPA